MHNKTIYRIASLIMALVMALGNIMHTQAVTGPSIYWGAMVDGQAPSSTNLAGVFNTFETRSQKRMSIIHWGQPWMTSSGNWSEFQTSYFDNVRNHGSIPMINWTSWRLGGGTNQSYFQLRNIYNGNYDAYITRWATDARNWGHPFFLRFNHEGNGWWYPWGEGQTDGGAIVNGNSAGDFVRAWRHVHDIFVSVGATNVTWVWSMNHMSTTSRYPALSTLYPGDAYVDWTGLSSYNKYDTWAGFNPLLTGSDGFRWFRNSYNDVLNVAPNKPLMLAEFGSFEAGDGGAKKAAWITDALTVQIPANFPKIKAVVWMNWNVEGRSYPIETSQAATNAWAAGIGTAPYASNQFANLNTSPIPPLLVPTGPADVAVNIGGWQQGSFTLQPQTSLRRSFADLNSGPVRINSTNGDPIVASQRVAYSPDGGSTWTSFNEMMGMPTGQLINTYVFPWYNNADTDMQLRFANVGTSNTTVTVTVAGVAQGSYALSPNQSMRVAYAGLNNGPVIVQSTGGVPIIASMRFAYIRSLDPLVVPGFSELMGLPANQLTSTYFFPWYNNVEMNTQLRFANVGRNTTTVTVTVGGVVQGSYSLGPNQSRRISYPNLNNGPVKIQSSGGVPIIASMRFVYIQSQSPLVVPYFSETMGLPQQNVSTNYWFPVYDNVNHDMQLRFGNLGTSTTTVTITVGNDVQGSYFLYPNQSVRISYNGLNAGPVQVRSSNGVTIIASMRFVYIRSNSPLVVGAFSEILGMPNEKLSNSYVFPWYNNVDMDTQLRIGVP